MRSVDRVGSRTRWLLLLTFLILPFAVRASDQQDNPAEHRLIRALVTETKTNPDNRDQTIYTLRLLEGSGKDRTVIVGDNETVAAVGYTIYQPGDRVLVDSIENVDSGRTYVINDYERRGSLVWLVGVFIAAVIWLNRWRGLRSLLGLAFSYLVIVGWIVPQIVQGASPLNVTLLGGAIIMTVALLLTEGWRRTTLAAGVSVFLTMLATVLLSRWAIVLTKLTGGGSEEAFYLQSMNYGVIDVRGLLLAGFLIGTLGVLDDIAVSQAATVGELRLANPRGDGRALYNSALRVGRSHMSAIVNTLILAYAGASLPLLVLFKGGNMPADLVLNSELVATEIVRSIVGSIGLLLALPISTATAVWIGVRSEGHKDDHSHHSPLMPALGRSNDRSDNGEKVIS